MSSKPRIPWNEAINLERADVPIDDRGQWEMIVQSHEMEPEINPGDTVVLDARRPPQSGEVFVGNRHDGSLVLRRMDEAISPNSFFWIWPVVEVKRKEK